MGFSDYRTALVTGASSGIGAATVRRLRAEGLEVHALARDVRRLASLSAETGCRACAVDVNDYDALMRLAGSAEFDVLVNNAGQSRRGNILEMASDDVDTLVDVNLRAVLHLTRLIAPGMSASTIRRSASLSRKRSFPSSRPSSSAASSRSKARRSPTSPPFARPATRRASA